MTAELSSRMRVVAGSFRTAPSIVFDSLVDAYVTRSPDRHASNRSRPARDRQGTNLSWRVHQRVFLDNAGNAKQGEVKAGGTTFRRTLSRAYNALGQMEALKDASQNATSFRYDLGAMPTLDAFL